MCWRNPANSGYLDSMKSSHTKSFKPFAGKPLADRIKPLRRCVLFAACTAGFILPSPGSAQTYVGKEIATYDASQTQDRSSAAKASAAKAFLDSLEPDLKSKALHPFTTPEKAVWSNLPPTPDYAGVRLGDLSDQQLAKAFQLIAASLSRQGFDKVKGILLGDDLLVREGQPISRMRFGADNYWFFIYGEPSTETPWGWQLDGHHLAINLTVVGDLVTLAPSFVGSQPADVEWAGKVSTKPMQNEVEQAFGLVNSLNAEQKQKTVIGPRRQDLEAGPGHDDVIPEQKGIRGSDLNESQKAALIQLIANWINILPEASAKPRLERITKDIDETSFGWWGETAPGSPVYYRIQGPRVLIEFANQNLGGNPQQHLHSVYRDPGNDYGKEWLPAN